MSNQTKDNPLQNNIQSTPVITSKPIATFVYTTPHPTSNIFEGSTPVPTIDPELQRENYKKKCQQYEYLDIARKPSSYQGKYIKFSGKVIQAQEYDKTSSYANCILRIAQDSNYDQIWLVHYKRSLGSDKILENDIITVYGKCGGEETYESVLGSEITKPVLNAELYDLGEIINGTVQQFDEELIKKQIEVSGCSERGNYSNRYYPIVKNNSDFQLDITVEVKFYDATGKLVGVQSANFYSLKKEERDIKTLFPDEDYSSVEYSISVEKSQYRESARSQISYSISALPKKAIITATNDGPKTVQSAEAIIVFYNGSEVVDVGSSYLYNGNTFELKAGESVSKEIRIFEEYTSYDVFIEAYIAWDCDSFSLN